MRVNDRELVSDAWGRKKTIQYLYYLCIIFFNSRKVEIIILTEENIDILVENNKN